MQPVYPMDEDEDNPGPVRLSARLSPSDEIAEIWRLEGEVALGTSGGEWRTVFDWSPDGLWLAAGAVHLDHETSRNEFHVVVRPVSEWLALAESRIALEELAGGRIRSGMVHLSRAGRYLRKDATICPKAAPPEPKDSPLEGSRIALDWARETTFARWSPDGKKFCVCEAWTDEAGQDRARCRMIKDPWTEWTPILVNLAGEYCTAGTGTRLQGTYHFFADGGYDGARAAVSVYMTGGKLGPDLGAVVEKAWDELLKNLESYPAFFHPVGVESPDGKLAAVGFIEEQGGDASGLEIDVAVKPVAEWIEMAAAEKELHGRSGPAKLDRSKPVPDLPGP